MLFIFYLEERRIVECKSVGQLSRFLKYRLTEHYRRMKKSRKLINLLIRQFKLTNDSSMYISIQAVEKKLYDDNSSKDKGIFSCMN